MTARDLIRRLRAGEIDYLVFAEEANKLSLKESEALTPLLLDWADPKNRPTHPPRPRV